MSSRRIFGPERFINRELSWLEFNSRVLDQAFDKGNPLLERVKFMAIFSNNLDEFFMVRVAGLRQQLKARKKSCCPTGMGVKEQIDAVRAKTGELVARQYAHLHGVIMPELAAAGIHLLDIKQIDAKDKTRLGRYFEDDIYPELDTMKGDDPTHPFPVMDDRSIQIAVRLRHPSHPRKQFFAFVPIPSTRPGFLRVAPLERLGGGSAFVLLEDLILEHLGQLFLGYEILDKFLFRITKDMDYTVDEEEASDLLTHMEHELLHTRRREPLRVEMLDSARGRLPSWLVRKLGLKTEDVYKVPGPLDLSRLFELVPQVARPELVNAPLSPVVPAVFKAGLPIFDVIRQNRTIPLFHPYESFEPVVRLLDEAAEDPNVLAVKQTLYRVSGDSPVVNALQRAAENGKKVTVVVELRARFDERRNIKWVKKLQESGAHVTYGMKGLKIHCKTLLIVRREEEGAIHRYTHISTGNYNDRTARLYTDIGLLLDDPLICADISAMFNIMTGYSDPPIWNKLSVAPFNLREKFVELIERETRLSTPHNPGHIIAKLNSLVDKQIIELLYAAAYKGVKIDLLVRGICCLKPGVGTKNISVTSVVDRFLEHSRIFYFQNSGNPEYYLASADWMPRNLDRRMELLFPVEDQATRGLLQEVLDAGLADRRKGRRLDSRGSYSLPLLKHNQTRSQTRLYEFFSMKSPQEQKRKLFVFKRKGNIG